MLFRSMRWKKLSGPNQKIIPCRTSEMIYAECALKSCYTLSNGELTVCPRGITTKEVYGVEKNPWEHIDIKKIGTGVCAKAKIATAISTKVYKDYCRYCMGIAEMNPYSIPPGIQIGSQGEILQ